MTKRITGHDVLRVVAEVTNTPMGALLGRRRTRKVARPRQLAAYLMREFCPHLSYPAIGRIMGGRDHSTIIHATQTISVLICTEMDLNMAAQICRARLAPRAEPAKVTVPSVPFWAMCYAYERAMQLGREGRKAA
jgi:chromosomal replication initiation ATPase DnaA